MKSNRTTHAVLALAIVGVLAVGSACAPSRAVVRGNWPDGRIEVPVRSARGMAVAVPRADVAPAVEDTGDWKPAESTADLSAADLNRRGVLETVFFAFDSDEIRGDAASTLERNAAWLRDNPGARIIVEGHCDQRGTRDYNLSLGQRRAEAARQYLLALGVDTSRIEVVSYGEELPAVNAQNETAWAKNRRADFVVVATGGY